MKALVKIKKGFGNVELIDVPEPQCKQDEIKIKVKAVGICGTDLHIYEGSFPYFNIPVILGHEFSGEIVEIGKIVKNEKNLCIGNKVTVLPSAAVICGSCEYCKSGNFIFCPERKGMGHGTNGAMTEYVCVREELVYKLSDNISFEEGSLTEPLSCCIQAVDDFVNISPTDSCLVSGPGTIGLLISSLLKMRNSTVVLTGISKDKKRLEIGKSIGIDIAINIGEKRIEKELIKELRLERFDICFECSGAASSLTSCINNLKKMGSLIQVGLLGSDSLVNLGNVVLHQLTLYGTLGFSWQSWGKSLEILKSGKLRADLLITHKYKLDEWEEAFRKSREDDSVKVIIEPA